MVNAEKHRRKAIENEVNSFINVVNGNTIRNLNKKENDLEGRIKPFLSFNIFLHI